MASRKDLPSELEAIRKATRRDYIFSDEVFISQLETRSTIATQNARPKTKSEDLESEKREPTLFG
jgi:hypothetical protein